MLTAELFADCGGTVGLGHVRRTLLLADTLRSLGVTCRYHLPDPAGVTVVERDGFAARIVDRRSPDLPAADILVADSYSIENPLSRSWNNRFACRVLFDDLGDRPVEAEIVLNPNFYGGNIDYSSYAATEVLAGPRYALIRSAFCRIRSERPQSAPDRILVSFGGADDGRFGAPIARRLIAVCECPIDVVASEVLPLAPAIAGIESDAPGRVTLYHGAPLERLMSRARIYVGGAGGSALEAWAAGLDLVICSLADNQRLNAAAFDAVGVASLPYFDADKMADAVVTALADPPAKGNRSIVDCLGAERVAERVLAHANRPVAGAERAARH
jgi:spore coat polysaccharide biosynthesis predicted glycosyltransferase SpsG